METIIVLGVIIGTGVLLHLVGWRGFGNPR